MSNEETKYHVRIKCDSGTTRLVHDTHGCYWMRVYHDITWTTEKTMDEAYKVIASIIVDGRWVLGAWISTDSA